MIRSMTGFANEFMNTDQYDLTVELKSLNSRYFDFKIKSSAFIDEWENDLKNIVYERLKRGKIDLYIKIVEKEAKSYNIIVNEELAKKYKAAISNLKMSLFLDDDVSLRDFLSIGGILQIERIGGFEDLHQILTEMIKRVTVKILDMMHREGEKTKEDLEASLARIDKSLGEIEILYPPNLEKFKQGLKDRLLELLPETLDDPLTGNRLLMEAEIMAGRTAINEEIVRLKSHLNQFGKILDEKIAGDSKKMDFISQEMNREINTIASKSTDYNIIENTIFIKGEIEKIREQLRNLE
jgi:uncharacterized protein (TIGR00255 family)